MRIRLLNNIKIMVYINIAVIGDNGFYNLIKLALIIKLSYFLK